MSPEGWRPMIKRSVSIDIAGEMGVGASAPQVRSGDELSRGAPILERSALVHPSVRMDRSSVKLGRGSPLRTGTVGTSVPARPLPPRAG